LLPNFGFGLIYYTEKLKLGLSIPRLLENKVDKGTVTVSKSEVLERAYYTFASYELKLGQAFSANPSVMLIYDALTGSALGVDVEAFYKNKIGVGIGYNSKGWLSSAINFAFSETFRLNYTYSWSNRLNNAYFSGSHEFTIVFTKKPKL